VTDEPLRRLTVVTADKVLEFAATTGFPALVLAPMMYQVPPGRAAWETFVAGASGTTLALARRKLQEHTPWRCRECA
jgi:hypothetical protein